MSLKIVEQFTLLKILADNGGHPAHIPIAIGIFVPERKIENSALTGSCHTETAAIVHLLA